MERKKSGKTASNQLAKKLARPQQLLAEVQTIIAEMVADQEYDLARLLMQEEDEILNILKDINSFDILCGSYDSDDEDDLSEPEKVIKNIRSICVKKIKLKRLLFQVQAMTDETTSFAEPRPHYLFAECKEELHVLLVKMNQATKPDKSTDSDDEDTGDLSNISKKVKEALAIYQSITGKTITKHMVPTSLFGEGSLYPDQHIINLYQEEINIPLMLTELYKLLLQKNPGFYNKKDLTVTQAQIILIECNEKAIKLRQNSGPKLLYIKEFEGVDIGLQIIDGRLDWRLFCVRHQLSRDSVVNATRFNDSESDLSPPSEDSPLWLNSPN